MKMKNLLLTMVITSLAMTSFNSLNAKTIYYVKTTGNGDGSSWNTAAGNIQDMIDKASAGDKVWVAGGNYPLTATLLMKQGINVYGGFSGNESSVSDRSKNDLDDNGIIDPWEFTHSTILDGQNARRILYQANIFTVETTWDGLIITKGKSTGDGSGGGPGAYTNGGGGVYLQTMGNIVNCVVSRDSTFNLGNGGGILNYGGTITNSMVSENFAASTGGGIYSNSGTISNCTIIGNSVSGNGVGGTDGGGIYNIEGGIIDNCIVNQNTVSVKASDYSTTFYSSSNASGGGIYNAGIYGAVTVTNCTVNGNIAITTTSSTAVQGGGIFNNAKGIMSNCCVTNNDLNAPSASQKKGGGIYSNANFSGSAYVYCSTIVNNSTGNIYSSWDYVYDFFYNCITDGSDMTQFVNPDANDYHLKAGSKYIDAGSLDNLPDWVINGTDLAGNPRTHNGKISMGAYEYDSSYTGINELQPLNANVYPNPATDYISINSMPASRVTISDLSGHIVYERKMEGGNESIAVSSWAKRVYLIMIQTGNNKTTSKIIKK